MRSHAQRLSANNQNVIKDIESSAFILALTDDEIVDDNEVGSQIIYTLIVL